MTPAESTHPVGRFTHAEDGWHWSDEARALLGAPGGDAPDALLERVHPEDRERLRSALEAGAAEGAAFGVLCRVTRGGTQAQVVVTGGREPAPDGHAAAARRYGGFVVDLSAELAAATDRSVSLQLGTALASHGLVDQAKGALMLVYGLDDDEAFDLLRWNSMRRNEKLTLLAQRVVHRLRERTTVLPHARDALEDELAREPADAPGPARGRRPAVVTTLLHDELPMVTVSGRADLRTAHELHLALEEAWGPGRRHGRILVDTTAATRIGPAARQVLAGTARRAARERVAVRVLAPWGDPAGLRRALPGGTVHESHGTAGTAELRPRRHA
ncbi:ANTAR domain-containing protein [Cellulomonas massiliensis]|uniref:ANTAR domain-containing protein n=1 Tax=Cellulomonas massiliensis TaxID=1465811 RepID=UPI0002F4F379|nr:ANTAR domain-containing protein [Cellulomonas massiliensis]